MKLRHALEDWRELCLVDDLNEVEQDELAEQLRRDVIEQLERNGYEIEWSAGQSVGAFVVVQSATAEEELAFDRAVEYCKKSLLNKS